MGMQFFGQEFIIKELNIILENLKREHSHINLLFRAPSGCGKTTVGLICIQYLGLDDFAYYIPDSSGMIKFREDKWIHFIDEIHALKHPEILYPYMDSNKYIFLLTSNVSGKLSEPLKDRCIQLVFQPYSVHEMSLIIKSMLKDFTLSEEMYIEIAKRCRNTPRVAKIICERLTHTFKSYLLPRNITELNHILKDILNIREDGINEMDQIYLDYLGKVRNSSLKNIIYGTGLDKETIITEIEPQLLRLNLIKITSRGREIC
jgi:Holliday junction resolvasome RuvABC ATP-dependent DNA helicase subunit